MSNKSKKRDKKYVGWDAKTDDGNVTVHKVTAVKRSNLGQWLHEHKKLVKGICIATAIIIVIILLFTVRF